MKKFNVKKKISMNVLREYLRNYLSRRTDHFGDICSEKHK